MKANKPTKEEIDRLKAWIESNDYTVFTVIRHVSKSGMQRRMNNRNRLLKLFQQNTGKTTVQAQRTEPSKVQVIGYQYPRMDKYKWQGPT